MKPKAKVKLSKDENADKPEKKKPPLAVMSQTEIVAQRAEREKALMDGIQKKFGQGIIATAGKVGYRTVPRLSTGVFALDVALGGGWAKGRMNLLWGAQSSCKTYLMLKMVVAAQNTDFFTNKPLIEVLNGRPYRICYIDVEGALDLSWAEKVGVNLDLLEVVRPEYAEQAAEIAEALMASGVYDIVILDSLAAMTTEKEMEGEMGDAHVGSNARLNNQMFRKLQTMMNKINNEDARLTPTFFIINQEREKIGVIFGSNKIKTGGRGQDFYTTMEVTTHPIKMEYYDPEEKTMPKFAHFRFRVEKNKVAPPKIEGGFILAVVDDPEGAFEAGHVMDQVTVDHYATRLELFKKINDTTWEMCGKTYKRKGDLIAEWYQDRENNALLKRRILHALFPQVCHGLPKKAPERGPVEVVENAPEAGNGGAGEQSQHGIAS